MPSHDIREEPSSKSLLKSKDGLVFKASSYRWVILASYSGVSMAGGWVMTTYASVAGPVADIY